MIEQNSVQCNQAISQQYIAPQMLPTPTNGSNNASGADKPITYPQKSALHRLAHVTGVDLNQLVLIKFGTGLDMLAHLQVSELFDYFTELLDNIKRNK